MGIRYKKASRMTSHTCSLTVEHSWHRIYVHDQQLGTANSSPVGHLKITSSHLESEAWAGSRKTLRIHRIHIESLRSRLYSMIDVLFVTYHIISIMLYFYFGIDFVVNPYTSDNVDVTVLHIAIHYITINVNIVQCSLNIQD